MDRPSDTWEDLRKETQKFIYSIFKGLEGVILIFGPSLDKKTDGSKIRKSLKERINKHIEERYKGEDIDIIAKFPEELSHVEGLLAEAYMVKHKKVKLAFCIWSKDSTGLISEITDFVKDSLIAMKLRIFIDETLISSCSFVQKETVLILKNVFNNVYPFDLRDKDGIIETALNIVDGHIKWASERKGEWSYDGFERDSD